MKKKASTRNGSIANAAYSFFGFKNKLNNLWPCVTDERAFLTLSVDAQWSKLLNRYKHQFEQYFKTMLLII